MAKRFTETTKWQDPWFRKLSGQAKLLWFFLIDSADPAGVVEIDYDLASEDCKIAIKPDHMAELGNRVQLFGAANEKVLIPKFIQFQYGSLSDQCFPHKRVFEAIKKHGLVEESDGTYRHPGGSAPAATPIKSESKPKAATKSKPESREEFDAFFREQELLPRDAEYAWNKWEGNGWSNGGKSIKDWRATVRTHRAGGFFPTQKGTLPNEKQWTGATAAKPPWLPANWKEIAVSIMGDEALALTDHTQIPTAHRYAFENACRSAA